MAPTLLGLVFVRRGGKLSVVARTLSDAPERGTAESTARATVGRLTALSDGDISLASTGAPVECPSDALDAVDILESRTPEDTVLVYPALFDWRPAPASETRADGLEWESPIAMLPYGTESPLWEAYDAVRPTVENIERDTEHGSATLSVRALEVLRDEAMLAAVDGGGVREVARSLMDARPTMTVLANRVARAVADSTDPRAIAAAAQDGIERAMSADCDAARNASARLDGRRVATLSRSGTVGRAIRAGTPAAILVAHSLPGGEGVDVAEELGGVAETTVTSDAAFPGLLGEWDADVLLVGADSILADGRVVNKMGTFPAAVAAAEVGVDVVVVTATDKVSPRTTFDAERRSGERFEVSDPRVAVEDPTFEATPVSYVDAVVTEDGTLTDEQIESIAADHATRRDAV